MAGTTDHPPPSPATLRPSSVGAMAQIYVRLTDATLEQLRELARRELRDPRDQAAVLIRDALARAGLTAERERAAPTSERRP